MRQSLAPGATVDLAFNYYLPVSTPSNWTVTIGGTAYALAGDLARGTTVVDPGTQTPAPTPTPTGTESPGPSPSPTDGTGQCTAPAWDTASSYGGGTSVSHQGHTWKSKWWTKGEEPGTTGEWGVWQDLGAC